MDIYLRFLFSTCKLVFILYLQCSANIGHGKYFHFIFFFQIDIRPCYFDERCKGNRYSFGPNKNVFFFSVQNVLQTNDSISPAAAGKQSSKIIKTS
jgi:hypothetical protein